MEKITCDVCNKEKQPTDVLSGCDSFSIEWDICVGCVQWYKIPYFKRGKSVFWADPKQVENQA